MLKKLLPFVLMFVLIAPSAGAAGLDFVPNVGQARDGSAFSTEIPGAHVAFRNTAVEYTFAVRSEPRRLAPARMNLVGANPRPEIAGTGLLPGIVNVHTATARFSEIPTYGGLRYGSVYPGIDLELDGGTGNLKSTWVVAPHADPARIRWRYEGFERVGIDAAGNLVLTLPTEPGEEARAVTETAPVAWQDVDGNRVPVEVRYQERKDGSLAFAVGAYDKDAPLVIDPMLVYNRKLYSLSSRGDSIAADAGGNVYLAGETTLGSSFVTRLDAGAVRQWTTYFDRPIHDLALGPANHVHLSGSGASGFIARLHNATGQLLEEFANGGPGHYAVAVDAQGNWYVAGEGTLTKRNAAGAPVYTAFLSVTHLTAVALDGVNPVVTGSEYGDQVYVAALNAGGGIIHETYFGGDGLDMPNDIAVDGHGRIFVAGMTTSSDFPLADPVDATLTDGSCEGPCPDGFIAQLSLDLDLLFSTYFGGESRDSVEGVAVEPDGTIFVAGWTETNAGRDFPLARPIAPLMGGGDAFAAKLALDETVGVYGIEFSTPLGDPDFDHGMDLALRGNSIYVTGTTLNTDATAFLAKLHDGLLPKGDVVNINFQPKESEIPDGYLPDVGAPYAHRGNGWSYGWVPFRNTDLPDLAAHDPGLESNQQYDTYIGQSDFSRTVTSWEIALKPGRYSVRVVAGNPESPGRPFWTQIYAEGVPVISDWRAEHPGNRWVEGIVDIAVADERLTLTLDSRTDPWTLAFLEISESKVANRRPQVAITAPLPLEVFNADRPVTIHAQADDRDGHITKVEFFATPAGGRRASLGDSPNPPYQSNWGCFRAPCVGVPPGTYTIEAVATDNEGAFSRSSVVVEVLPLETKRDEFKVELKVFLPHETVDHPFIPEFLDRWAIKGDDRSFSTTSREYRAAQQVTVIPAKALDADGIDHTTIANLAGPSVLYDTGSSVNPETGRLTLQARSEGLAHANEGVPYMVGFGRMELNASVKALPRPDAFTSVTRFEAAVSDPVVDGLCEIDWRIDVTIDANNPAGPLAKVSGSHDGMPAYEIYVDGQPVYRWRPLLNLDIGFYCDPARELVNTGYIPLK